MMREWKGWDAVKFLNRSKNTPSIGVKRRGCLDAYIRIDGCTNDADFFVLNSVEVSPV